MCFPARTSSEKLGALFSHPRSVNKRRAAAPPGRDFIAVGSWPGAPGPRRARLGTELPTRPNPEPPGAGGSATFPAPEGPAPCARIPGWHANPRTAAPRRAQGLTRSLGLSGASPRPAPGPAGSESARLPWLGALRPGCAGPSSAARRLDPDPGRGGGGGAGEEGWGGGAGGWCGALPQGPGRRESRLKGVARDAANFAANCRARPAPRLGTHAPRRRGEMLSCRRGSGRGFRTPSRGAARRQRKTGGVGGGLGASPGPHGRGDVAVSACPARGARRRLASPCSKLTGKRLCGEAPIGGGVCRDPETEAAFPHSTAPPQQLLRRLRRGLSCAEKRVHPGCASV